MAPFNWDKMTHGERVRYWRDALSLDGASCSRCGKTGGGLGRTSLSMYKLPPGEDTVVVLCESCRKVFYYPKIERPPGRPKGSLNKKTLAKLKAMTPYERMCYDAARSS